MKVRCPACGAGASLDALVGHAAAREHLLAAYRLSGRLGDLVLTYFGLFRPPARELSMQRVAALAETLLPTIAAGRVQRQGRTWAAPLDAWLAALDTVIAARDAGTLKLPLKSHGYLLAIIAGQADQVEGRQEAAREDRRRVGSASRCADKDGAKHVAKHIPDHVRKALNEFRRPAAQETPNDD